MPFDNPTFSYTVTLVKTFTSAQTPAISRRQRDGLKRLFDLFESELEAVERNIAAASLDFEPEVQSYVAYVTQSKGKRLRPLLVFLSARLSGKTLPSHADLATVIELIHLATLIHDDIMDGADLRRGRPSANAKWGNALSVLLGDTLFAHALMLSTNFDDRDVTRRIASAANTVCSGEILQTQRRFDLGLGIDEYLRIISMKTAALFSAATGLSARLNACSTAQVKALEHFGDALGTAYQIYDDCLDIVGEEESALKSLGTDFAKGKLTLPLLIALEESNPEEREALRELILKADPADSAVVRRIVRDSGALDQSLERGLNLLQQARDEVTNTDFPGSQEPLSRLLDGVTEMLQRFSSHRYAANGSSSPRN